jgi:hypothetical protein
VATPASSAAVRSLVDDNVITPVPLPLVPAEKPLPTKP